MVKSKLPLQRFFGGIARNSIKQKNNFILVDTKSKLSYIIIMMNDCTSKEQTEIRVDGFVELEDGSIVTRKVYDAVLEHYIHEHTKNIVYKVDETVYYIMRNEQPA